MLTGRLSMKYLAKASRPTLPVDECAKLWIVRDDFVEQ